MKKILYFLMVGLAFTALQAVTVEAAKDCSDFEPGTPSFESCQAVTVEAAKDCSDFEPGTTGFDTCMGGNQEAAGGPSAESLETPGMPPTAGNPAAGMPGTAAPMGDPAAGMPGTAAPMGAPGTAPMGDTSAKPSIGERVKSFFGMGNDSADTPPTGAPGEASVGALGTAPMGAPTEAGHTNQAAPGSAADGSGEAAQEEVAEKAAAIAECLSEGGDDSGRGEYCNKNWKQFSSTN